MNKVLDGIRSQVGEKNLAVSCGRDKCRVCMTDVPFPRVVIDVDLALPDPKMEEKRCDYVLFFIGADKGTLVTVPMELKSGDVDASDAFDQLQQGAEFAERLTTTAFRSICRPVLLHGKGIDKYQYKKLNRSKVRFRGKKLTIKMDRCGSPKNLARALK